MQKFVAVLTGVLLSGLLTAESPAQIHQGDWSLGLHGGVNYWINDLNQFKIGQGGSMIVRYNLTRNFSLGLMGSYEALKTQQDPPFTDLDLGLSAGYLRSQTITGALVAYLHFAPDRKVSPYLYLGGGAAFLKRKVAGTKNLPMRASFAVPAGLGVEAFVSERTSLSFDAGFKLLADWGDLRRNNSPDGIASVNAGLNFYFGPSESDDDDDDGLSNGEERRFGSNPNNPDTDGDGLKDGEEVKRFRTNPLKVDTDGDGLTDGEEVLKYHTDPTRYDTDGDALSDGDELMKYKTDALKMDTDGDGLSDGDEVTKYRTDLLKVDTDGDGLSDWDEVMVYKSDPNKPDTDNDDLSDGDEVRRFKSDPLKVDTDGGGTNDGVEVQRGANPLDPRDDKTGAAIKLEKGKAVVLEGINFSSGSARILISSEPGLQKALEALRSNPSIKIDIVGYTDNLGSVVSNDRLSRRRAEAVRDWLVKHGIPANRMYAIGKGHRDPIAPNSTLDGRAKNRRIEFHVR